MANKRITELPAATTPLSGTELFECVQGGINVKVAKTDVATGGGAVTFASTAEINTGTEAAKAIAPDQLQLSKYETQYGLRTFAASTTAANTYTASLTPSITTYGSGGLLVKIRFTNANTGAATLNLNGLGAISMVRTDGLALLAGDIPAGGTSVLQYNGTNFVLLNPAHLASTSATASTPTWWDANKKLVTAVASDIYSFLGIDITRTAVTNSAGTVTMTLTSKIFADFVTTAAQSSAFAIAFGGTTSQAQKWSYAVPITGAVGITLPSSCYMVYTEKIAGRWNDATKVLTLTGATASWFLLTFVRIDSSTIRATADTMYLV